MAGKTKIKNGIVATDGFIAAFNKLTCYPRASFSETYRLSEAKRVIHEARERFRDAAMIIAKKLGTDEGEKGIKIPAGNRQQYSLEISKLEEQEVKLPLNSRMKLNPTDVPEKYFTADDLFFLAPLIEIVEPEEVPAKK